MEARHTSGLGCPICGQIEHPITAHIRLTAEQAKDLGIDPEKGRGGITIMAEPEVKQRYPKAEVNEGQKHGYIGADVDIYDPATGKVVGHGTRVGAATSDDDKDTEQPAGESGTIKADDTPEAVEAPAGGGKRR